LYLDTFNCNGHTSAVDALYSGIPVITKIGKSFSSRVCASILNACDMSELVTKNINQYYKLAIKISENKSKFEDIKYKLNSNLIDKPLFNTKKYVDNLEKAYSLVFADKNNHNKIKNIIVK